MRGFSDGYNFSEFSCSNYPCLDAYEMGENDILVSEASVQMHSSNYMIHGLEIKDFHMINAL